MTQATTTIAYKYLPVLVARLISQAETFSIGEATPDNDEVNVFVNTKQSWLDEWANEAHGGFVINLTCADVWAYADASGYDISDSRYDAAEAVLADVRSNLAYVWEALEEAIDAALISYCEEI